MTYPPKLEHWGKEDLLLHIRTLRVNTLVLAFLAFLLGLIVGAAA